MLKYSKDTLGYLAAKNTIILSKNKKDKLNKKYNTYKNIEPKRDLPNGMNRLGTIDNRFIPIHQNKKDPKYKNAIEFKKSMSKRLNND